MARSFEVLRIATFRPLVLLKKAGVVGTAHAPCDVPGAGVTLTTACENDPSKVRIGDTAPPAGPEAEAARFVQPRGLFFRLPDIDGLRVLTDPDNTPNLAGRIQQDRRVQILAQTDLGRGQEPVPRQDLSNSVAKKELPGEKAGSPDPGRSENPFTSF
jgi:hypothetical protein